MAGSVRSVAMGVAAVLFGISAGQAKAALIAYEDFNYGSADKELQGLNGGTGFDTAWNRTYGSSAAYAADGLSFGDLAVSGGSGYFSSATKTVATRKLAAGLSGTVWGSYLFKVGADTPGQWNGAGLANFTNPLSSGQWQYVSAITNSSVPAVGIKGLANGADGGALDNSAMMMLFKIINTGAASSTMTQWILTADQFDYWKSQPGGLDSLTASTALGTTGATVWGRASVAGNADSLSTAYLGIHVLNDSLGASPTYYDEFRLGTTADDVTPLVDVVPEPATMAFLALGGLAMAGSAIRRRRKA